VAAASIQISKGRISEVPGIKVRAARTIRKRQREAGIALLIAIFVLLLIGVVAIALVVSSGTESALAGNYRSSTGVYYAAVAGLEEVRARLRPNSPNYFGTTDPGFLPPAGSPLSLCAPVYVINPVGGVAVTPWDAANAYHDNEFGQELGGICGGGPPSPSPSALSIWNRNPLNGLVFPGPLYRWVRINGVTEQSLNLDASPYDTTVDNTLVYYDGAKLNDTATGNQVLEVTALAVLPNGSQKVLQYLVAPTPLNLNFNAALTLDGNNVQFTAPNTTNFWVRGNDQYSAGGCNPGPGVVTAVGYTNSSDASQANILAAIQTGPPPSQDRRGNYTNGVSATPNVSPVALSGNLQTVAGLNALVQTITQNADVVINGNATEANMPAAMSATNPMTIVVSGDLTFNGWHNQGYGLLLVTGTFTFDPDATWNGIVLVIGRGMLYSHQSGSGQLNGAVFLASTDPLVAPYFEFTSSSGSNGIYYSSCWIQAAMPTAGYKILSFHEIAQ
jgi:Tfp pilus assembly protein PilX